jgi:hypothetical protein
MVSRIALVAAAAAGLASICSPAAAAIEKVEFSGYFLGGSAAPFPTAPATFSATLTYDSAATALYDYGFSAWYDAAVTSFAFHSIGAAPSAEITGSYSGSGAGQFVIFHDNGGLDALQPAALSVQGLTGIAPAGYALDSAGVYFYDANRVLQSVSLPSVSGGAKPWSDFSGQLFFANYKADGGGAVTIYGTIDSVAVPEPSTWALLILGFGGLALLARRGARKTATA